MSKDHVDDYPKYYPRIDQDEYPVGTYWWAVIVRRQWNAKKQAPEVLSRRVEPVEVQDDEWGVFDIRLTEQNPDDPESFGIERILGPVEVTSDKVFGCMIEYALNGSQPGWKDAL